ncbi:MAG: S8 family peptidase [Asgard group archaeon]|nr:S8 family peptidase [Asgard group archaeon]
MDWLKKLDPAAYNVLTIIHEATPSESLELIFISNKHVKGIFSIDDHKQGLEQLELMDINSSYITELNGKVRTIIGNLGIFSLSVPVKKIVKKGLNEINDKIVKIGLAQNSFPVLNSSKNIIMGEQIEIGDGSGIKIGIVDSGVDQTHPDLNVTTQFDVTSDDGIPELANKDKMGHGTHVAGIVASSGNKNSTLKGIAAGAEIIAAKVFSNRYIGAYRDKILAAIEKCISQYKVDIINLSLGELPMDYYEKSQGFQYLSRNDDSYQIAYERIRKEYPQVILVAAAGNDSDVGTINLPAEYNSLIAVGSVEKDKKLSYFSSKGPTRDGRIKPEIVAPGGSIYASRSVFSNDKYIGNDFEGNEYYTTKSGTSMATPHIVGIVAVILKELKKHSQYQNTKYDRHELIKRILMHSASDLGLKAIEQGAGLVCLPKTIEQIRSGKVFEPIKLTERKLTIESIEPQVIDEFVPFKTIIPYSTDLSEKVAVISTLAKNLQKIQDKFILSSIGPIGRKIHKAVLTKETTQGLTTFRYSLPIKRLQMEIQDILELEKIHANYTETKHLYSEMANALSMIEQLETSRKQMTIN